MLGEIPIALTTAEAWLLDGSFWKVASPASSCSRDEDDSMTSATSEMSIPYLVQVVNDREGRCCNCGRME